VSEAAGRRLGSYEILALIGKGGMGEVYRALDHKLGREVALKLLPESFAHDPERLQRFEREARILASLNHPNIATLHGLEESGRQHFLVMELVPGETLAERISLGPIPLDEVIPLFRQIAEALEAAHEKGVIHRDLKPANIKITPEGKVRVLDFGLAKVFEDGTPSTDLSHSPTVTREGTRVGTVMGTAAYMSPEQTRGKRLDRRSDLWAFGCCLFEALSGTKAFDGETVTDVFAAIVRGEPDWSRLPHEVPASLRVLLQRCLTKDLSHRLRDAGDAAIELEEAFRSPATLARPDSKSSRRAVVAVGLGLGVLALGIGIGSLLPGGGDSAGTVKRLELNLPAGLTLGDLENQVAVLSPDGERIAFVARSRTGRDQLYLRTLDDGTTTAIPGTEGASHPSFSPDSEWIAFAAGRFLKKVDLRGGAPVPICTALVGFGLTWGEDDTIVFVENAPGLLGVPASGGRPTRFTKEGSFPRFLPGGKSLLVGVQGGISVVSLATGESKRIVDKGSSPRYVGSGHLVYEYQRSLYAAEFDLDTFQVRGPAHPLPETVRKMRVGPAQYDVAKDGSLVYLAGASSATAEKSLVWVDRDGRFEPVTQSRRAFGSPRLSPDDRRVALEIAEGGTASDVWIHDIGRDALRRATLGGGRAPLWSSDGRITYAARLDDGWYLLRNKADGSGEAEKLIANGDRSLFADMWSPDGKTLLYTMSIPERGWDEFQFSTVDSSSRSFVSSPHYDSEGAFSPDGRWVLYSSDESGSLEVYVQALAEPARRWQISDPSGHDAVWTSGGSEIVYRSGRQIMSVAVRTEPEFEASTPQVLFEGPFELETAGFRNFDVTKDGKRFVMIQTDEGPLDRLVFVVNWVDELRRLFEDHSAVR